MARRDDILAYAAELLDLGSFPDYGPQGLQVEGAPEVSKVVCAVSSSLELFARAAARVRSSSSSTTGSSGRTSRASSTPGPPPTRGALRRGHHARRLPPRARRPSGDRKQRAAARELGVEVDGGSRGSASAARADAPRDDVPRRASASGSTRRPRLRARGPDPVEARRDLLRRRRPLSHRGGPGGLRPLLTGEPGGAEHAPRRASSGSRSSPPATTRPSGSACRRSPRGSPSASASSGSSSSCRTRFEPRRPAGVCFGDHASPGGAGPLISRHQQEGFYRARRAQRADGLFSFPTRKEPHAEPPHA